MWTILGIFMLTVCSSYAQTVTHTNGSSGVPCPFRKCLADKADCIGGQCVCRPPFVQDINNGHFACYRPSQAFGEVKNDPTVRNFNNETAQFQYPCRYLLTSTTTTLRIRKQDYGTCTCQMHAWNAKHRGKFFAGGFDFACLIDNTVLGQQLEFSVRIEGIAQNDAYTYTELSVNQFLPNGPWTTAPLSYTGAGLTVKSSYDTVNNQARVTIPECGWAITFVAYDIAERRNQDQIPGLSFAVNCGLDPFFLDHDKVIATAPVKFGGTTYKDLAVPPLTVPQALLIRAFNSDVVQNQPDFSAQCATVGNFLDQCGPVHTPHAAEGCFWMLDEPRLIRCLDGGVNASPILSLLQTCISFYCQLGVTCAQFQQAVINTNCGFLSGIPRLANIVNGNICI